MYKNEFRSIHLGNKQDGNPVRFHDMTKVLFGIIQEGFVFVIV